MKTLIIIPSRLSATRLPGKPLLEINGKSIISHVFKKAEEANIGDVFVATEDIEIMDDVKKLRDTSTLEMFKIINKCVRELHHREKIYNGPDMPEKELDEFFESMSAEQFIKVNNFFDTMPRLRHYISVTNPNTKVESKVLMEGLEHFLV